MSYDNPRWGRRISPFDTYAIQLIEEVHDFLASKDCKPELKHEAQHLINQIRYSEVTLTKAELILASLEERNEPPDEE